MEGVEDIPEPVLTEGLPWDWQSFPEYLDRIAARRFDIDVAAQVPHAALRVFVMGERGVAASQRPKPTAPPWLGWPLRASAPGHWAFRPLAH